MPLSQSARKIKLLDISKAKQYLTLGLFLFLCAAARAADSSTIVVCDDVADPMTMDPHKQFSEKNHTIIQQIYEGIVRFTPDGKIEPALATSWKRLSPTEMQFYLRPDVKFHNGEPFDAETVKFSIERYLNPETEFPAVGFINTFDHVVVVDSHTVNIVTKYPDGLLLNRLAGFIVMVPPKYFRENGANALNEHPVGTGPFIFEKWEKGRKISLVINKDYWMKGYPKVGKLVFKFIPADQQMDLFLRGEIDILTNLPGTRTLDVEKNPDTYVVKKPSFYTIAGSFNTCRGPLSNRNIRKALNIAINKSDLIRYDVLGNGIALGTLTLPGEFGHNSDIMPYQYDLDEAKRIMKKEGYGEGFKLKVFLKANVARTGNIIFKQLERIGIKVNATLVTDAELLEFLKDRNQWDILMADCPDPMCSAFFIPAAFLYSKSPFSLCNNKAVDEDLETLVGITKIEDQESMFRKLDKKIYDEALCLFTYQRIRTYGMRKIIKFEPYVSGMHYFYSAFVKTEEQTTNDKTFHQSY